MPLTKLKTYTAKDYWNLSTGQRAELIDGMLYAMAPPSRLHQKLVMELSAALLSHIRERKGECEVYPAPFAVNLNADDLTYVEPDISVICEKEKLTDKGCQGAPDLIIEVISPTSRKMDYSRKNLLYSDAGVKEYWIVDPEKKRTTVYHYLLDAAPIIVPFEQPISSVLYRDLAITIAQLLV